MSVRSMRLLVVGLALLVLGGCASNKSLYYWGAYEPIIYDIYVNPGEADPQTQVDKLTATIQQAQSSDKQIPPGLYAHLGMVYAQLGDAQMAAEAFIEEKTLYPESATFVDGILERSNIQVP